MKMQVVLALVGGLGVAHGQSMNMLGVAAQGTLAVPVAADPGMALDGKLDELRELVRRARVLAGTGLLPLEGERLAEWEAGRTRAAQIIEEFTASYERVPSKLDLDNAARAALDAAYAKLKTTRIRVRRAVAVPDALHKEASAIQVTTEHPGWTGVVRDQFGSMTWRFRQETPTARQALTALDDFAAAQLLPPSILAWQAWRREHAGASSSGRVPDRSRELVPREPTVPNAAPPELVEKKSQELAGWVAMARRLVPPGSTPHIARNSNTFVLLDRLARDFDRDWPAWVASVDRLAQAQLGHAELIFRAEAAMALAPTKFERYARQPVQASELQQLEREANKLVAQRPDGSSQPFLESRSGKAYPWHRQYTRDNQMVPDLLSLVVPHSLLFAYDR